MVSIAALATIPSAWCYAWATIQFTPVVNPFLTAIMACWLSLMSRWATAYGKIRHPVWMGRAGAAIGLLGWYAQWLAWIVISERHVPGQHLGNPPLQEAFQLCWRPDLLVRVALDVVVESGSILGGAFCIFFWLAELLALVLLPRVGAARRAGLPFCEEVQEWAKEIRVPAQFAFIEDADAVRHRLEADPGALPSIIGSPIDPESPRFAELTFYRCGGKTSFVTIENFAELAPHEVPLPGEAMSGNAEYFAQVDEPVVELLRVPVSDPDRTLRRWEEAASGLAKTLANS